MSLEVFEQGPSAYIPYLVVSLLLTLLEYAPVPILFALLRKKGIGSGQYRVICYVANFVIMAITMFFSGSVANGGPYLLWTTVFSFVGIKILEKKGILY